MKLVFVTYYIKRTNLSMHLLIVITNLQHATVILIKNYTVFKKILNNLKPRPFYWYLSINFIKRQTYQFRVYQTSYFFLIRLYSVIYHLEYDFKTICQSILFFFFLSVSFSIFPLVSYPWWLPLCMTIAEFWCVQ